MAMVSGKLEASYDMKVDRAAKIFHLAVVGSFDKELVAKFINDYQRNVASIRPGEYKLQIDCTSMQVITPEMYDSMESCHRLYQSSGFGEVIFVTSGSPVLKSQMARIARKAGLDNISFLVK